MNEFHTRHCDTCDYTATATSPRVAEAMMRDHLEFDRHLHPCAWPDCGNEVRARGLCPLHYMAARTAGTLDQYPTRYGRDGLICDCEYTVEAFGALGECLRCHRLIATTDPDRLAHLAWVRAGRPDQ